MVYYKTYDEINSIKESCLLVSKTLAELSKMILPGVSTNQINDRAEEFIRDNKAIPAFKNYRGFPKAVCISVNDSVVHGIPDDTFLKEGDIISVDCGVLFQDYYGDSAYTFPVGEVSTEITQLMEMTKKALTVGIDVAKSGNRIGDIGYAIQQFLLPYNYGIVRDLVGHGVGRNLHEEPEVPHFGKRGQGMKMEEGLVIAIEPMINMGTKDVIKSNDGWTIKTKDGKPSAHYEHTVVIRKNKAEILSTFDFIEKEVADKVLV